MNDFAVRITYPYETVLRIIANWPAAAGKQSPGSTLTVTAAGLLRTAMRARSSVRKALDGDRPDALSAPALQSTKYSADACRARERARQRRQQRIAVVLQPG